MISYGDHRGTGTSLLGLLNLCRELNFEYSKCGANDDFYSMDRIQALSQVCRSIYAETVLLHYSQNLFYFTSRAMLKFVRVTPPVFIEAVRQIGTSAYTPKEAARAFKDLRLVGLACPKNAHQEARLREHEQWWLAQGRTVKVVVGETCHWLMDLNDQREVLEAARDTRVLDADIDQ